jgi:hypothetical protein
MTESTTDKTIKAIRNQIASARMEGISFTERDYELIEQIVNNKLTIAEAINIIKKKV